MKTSKILLLHPVAFVVALGGLSCQGQPLQGTANAAPSAELKTEDQKTFYALGMALGRNLTVFHLTPPEFDVVKRGLADAVSNAKPQVALDVYGPKIAQLAQTRGAADAKVQEGKSKPFLEKAAKEPGAQVKPSGLVFKSLRPGKGDKPGPKSTVKVHYHGTLVDGRVFDSSVERGQPAEFPLGQVIPCWTEGLQLMKVGEKAKLTCPAQLAYGAEGRPPVIAGGATLVFEVELLEVKK